MGFQTPTDAVNSHLACQTLTNTVCVGRGRSHLINLVKKAGHIFSENVQTLLRGISIIALLLKEEDREKTKKRRRTAVHPMLKKRKLESEYWTLYKELIDHKENFSNIFV